MVPVSGLAGSHSHGASQLRPEPVPSDLKPGEVSKYERIARFITECYEWMPGATPPRKPIWEALYKVRNHKGVMINKDISYKYFNKVVKQLFPDIMPGYRVRCPREGKSKRQAGALINIQPKKGV